MTSPPPDVSALLAQLDTLAPAANAGEVDIMDVWERLGDSESFGAFIVALVNAWPALAAAIRDGEERVEMLRATLSQVDAAAIRALTARLDAAEKVCRAVGRHTTDDGSLMEVLDLYDAWRALSPSGDGHDTGGGR